MTSCRQQLCFVSSDRNPNQFYPDLSSEELQILECPACRKRFQYISSKFMLVKFSDADVVHLFPCPIPPSHDKHIHPPPPHT